MRSADKRRQTDAAFLEVLRIQNELGAKRLAQTAARLALATTTDTPLAGPSRPGWQA